MLGQSDINTIKDRMLTGVTEFRGPFKRFAKLDLLSVEDKNVYMIVRNAVDNHSTETFSSECLWAGNYSILILASNSLDICMDLSGHQSLALGAY